MENVRNFLEVLRPGSLKSDENKCFNQDSTDVLAVPLSKAIRAGPT
jgi:hypothetical protein